MNCPNCGLAAHENDKFCIGCGTRLRKPESAAPAPAVEEAAPVVIPPVEEIVPAVEEKAGELKENACEAVEAAENSACEAVNNITEEAAEVIPAQVEAVEQAVENAAEPVAEAVEQAAEPVVEAVEKAAEPVVEAVEKAAEPVVEPVAVPPVQEPVADLPFGVATYTELDKTIALQPSEQTKEIPVPDEDDDSVMDPGSVITRLNKPLSVWGYVWRILLFSIPILSIIPLFVMAFSRGINKNSKHFASAILVLMLIALILAVGGVIYVLLANDPATINNFLTDMANRLK